MFQTAMTIIPLNETMNYATLAEQQSIKSLDSLNRRDNKLFHQLGIQIIMAMTVTSICLERSQVIVCI